MHTFEFLDGYPSVEIELVKENRTNKLDTIIDTGSPYTILPESALLPLNLQPEDVVGELWLRGIIHEGKCEATVPAYAIDVNVAKRNFADIIVAEYDFHPTIGILGHNVLKEFQLIVNWKKRLIRLE